MAGTLALRTTVKYLRLHVSSTKGILSSSPYSTAAAEYAESQSSWSNLLLFVPGAITFGLGTWQIFRREEKIKVIDHRASRLSMEPLKSDEIFNSSSDSLEFRRVKMKGTYDEGKSIFIGPRSRSISGVTENGYYIITPLLPVLGDIESAQSPILVNRGWVPRSWRDKAVVSSKSAKTLPSNSSPGHEETKQVSRWFFWSKKQEVEKALPATNSVEVIGVVRGSEKPSIFVPANDPGSRQWFYVDTPAIARACGLPEDTFYVEDINEDVNASSPYPLPKDVNALIRSSVMPQDHLNYTITWYTLSAAVTVMAIKRLKPKRRRG